VNYLTIFHILLGVFGCALSFVISLDFTEVQLILIQDYKYLKFINTLLIVCISYVSISVAAKATRYKARTVSWTLNLISSGCIVVAMILSIMFTFFSDSVLKNSVLLSFIFLSIGVWVKILVSIYAFFKFKSNNKKEKIKNREYGTIKWFNTDKGFGFISRNTGDDLFVHHRAFVNSNAIEPKEGQQVQFLINKGYKGLQAYSVRIIELN
jgi:CspA family cold shock protein